MARLHLRTAIAGYGHIFPPEAPPPTLDEVLAQWRQWLGADRAVGRRGFVADDGTGLLGVVLAGPDPIEEGAGHIARLYVDRDQWGRGIGTLLYQAAIAYLVDRGFREATLWVLEANDRARWWYERLGWRPTGERKAVYPPAAIDDLRYRVTLAPVTGGPRNIVSDR